MEDIDRFPGSSREPPSIEGVGEGTGTGIDERGVKGVRRGSDDTRGGGRSGLFEWVRHGQGDNVGTDGEGVGEGDAGADQGAVEEPAIGG